MTPLRDLTGDQAADELGVYRPRFGPPIPWALRMKMENAAMREYMDLAYQQLIADFNRPRFTSP